MVCFVVTQHSESELSLCLRYSKTSSLQATPKKSTDHTEDTEISLKAIVQIEKEAVFAYGLFNYKFIRNYCYKSPVSVILAYVYVANIRIITICSKFFGVYFSTCHMTGQYHQSQALQLTVDSFQKRFAVQITNNS